jgi:hypothetical protein
MGKAISPAPRLQDTLAAILAGRRKVTLGHFELDGRKACSFGLSHSPNYGTKPTYDGRSGRGGGFDPQRWTLIDMLRHELGEAMNPAAVLVLDGCRYTRGDFAGPMSWEGAPTDA